MPEQPTQQPPPVQRLRIQYAKRGRLRFTSHRDFSRAFERALFRARVPMAYSSGFNPHPRISFAGAAPTGSASEAEYLEIALAQVCDPAQLHQSLDQALPQGLDIIRVVPAGAGALADHLTGSIWTMELAGFDQDRVSSAVTDFLAQPAIEVERMTKKGLRTIDVRASVVALTYAGDTGQLLLTLRHSTPTVRPGDILVAMGKMSELDFSAVLQTRTHQGRLTESGQISDPLVD
ncbi:MAG TPA: TIGR03936 family radical SAM-associated protein [Marmoricola sp.]|nr:TIGR03936 family radical SAM-associated protein [Marmoricola sp.]HNN48230.1 TIGR03936 family radical SAM-associated protein [Marmoricola sp.]HNO39539.1 TIGR03936 family radical SAM-associated protein [Marmoricola sp.]